MAIRQNPYCGTCEAPLFRGQTHCSICFMKQQQQQEVKNKAKWAKQAKADGQTQARSRKRRKPPRVVNLPLNGKSTGWQKAAGIVGFLLFGAMALAAGSSDPSVLVAIVFAVVGGAILSKLFWVG